LSVAVPDRAGGEYYVRSEDRTVMKLVTARGLGIVLESFGVHCPGRWYLTARFWFERGWLKSAGVFIAHPALVRHPPRVGVQRVRP
jgi:hypothetical protein